MVVMMMLLQGCVKQRGCKIDSIYPHLQVNGKKGLSRNQLMQSGVHLCARNIAKKETYMKKDMCSKPEDLFPDGVLPEIGASDLQMLLLVKCPSSIYPKGYDMQRVTCSHDIVFDENGEWVRKELVLFFDTTHTAENCIVNESIVEVTNASRLDEDNQSGIGAHFQMPEKNSHPKVRSSDNRNNHATHVSNPGNNERPKIRMNHHSPSNASNITNKAQNRSNAVTGQNRYNYTEQTRLKINQSDHTRQRDISLWEAIVTPTTGQVVMRHEHARRLQQH